MHKDGAFEALACRLLTSPASILSAALCRRWETKAEPQRASATNAKHWRLCLHSGTFKIASDLMASPDAFAASAAFIAAYRRQ